MRNRSLRAFVFDAYGTLFDVHSIAAAAEAIAPRQGALLSQIWRTKQLQYMAAVADDRIDAAARATSRRSRRRRSITPSRN